MTTNHQDTTNPSSFFQQTIESPFPSQQAFVNFEEDSSQSADDALLANSVFAETPFPSVFELENDTGSVDPETEEIVAFLNELDDEEFDDALYQVISEAEGLLQGRFEAEFADPMAKTIAGKRMMEAHVEPLARELELFLDGLAQELEQYDIETMAEAEFDELVDRYEPGNSQLSPAFENLFGGLRKKLKKAVKRSFRAVKRGVSSAVRRGVQAAKTVGRYAVKGLKGIAGGYLKTILKKLKRLVKPLLKRVLDGAINRMPSQYRPIARTLRDKLLRAKTLREFDALEDNFEFQAGISQSPADISAIQREFDEQIAYLVYADDEDAQDAALAEYETQANQFTAENALDALDQARTRFIKEITELEEGADPAPIVENFVPALLPVLKLGIRLYGRSKVIRLLAKYVAKLIGRFVGKKYTPMLSSAIVDAGMRMIHLEASAEDETNAAGAAVAATVEDTVRQVAAMPEYLLDDEALLEGAILEAFEQAAAANLPPVLPETVYENRPELREASGVKGTWLMQPLRGRKRYKKFSRIFNVNISPHAVRKLKTFRGFPLRSFLRRRYRLSPGRKVKARVHLYETIPGTTLNDITTLENLGNGGNMQAHQGEPALHPLTSEAAGILLNEPGLGNRETPPSMNEPLTSDVGQRYYFLEILEAPAQALPVTTGKNKAARPSQFKLILDFSSDQIRAFIFMSEAQSQVMATKLRQRVAAGNVLPEIRKLIETGVKSALTAQANHLVKIIHGTIPPEQSRGLALKWLPPIILETMGAKLIEWLGQHIAQQLQKRHQEFITATENLEDGVTMIVKLSNPPGFASVAKLLRGEAVRIQKISFAEGTPNVSSQIVPGLTRG